MKKIITLILIVILIINLSFAQNTQTPTQKNIAKKPVTIFTLHVLTFNNLVKSNLEKDLKGLDDSFKMSIPIYHPAIGLNLSFYTKLSQKGNPYPSMINRILKNLVFALNSSELPDKTNINIILYTEDEKNIYDSKTLFITFTLSSLKEFAKAKDINKFGSQMLVFLETEKLEYKNGVFSSKNYDFEWILKI